MKNILKYITIAAVFVLAGSISAEAQPGRRFYVDAGWQLIGAFGFDFVKNASGWVEFEEGGYYVMR